MPTPAIPAATSLSAATNGDESEFLVSLDETAWTAVAELTELADLPAGEQSNYETTHMKSGAFKEWKKNKRKDGTETDLVFNYTIGSAAETTLLAMEAAPASLAYQLILKQGAQTSTWTGRALFYNVRRSNPMEEKRTMTITAKWMTTPTVTTA